MQCDAADDVLRRLEVARRQVSRGYCCSGLDALQQRKTIEKQTIAKLNYKLQTIAKQTKLKIMNVLTIYII